MTPIRVSSVSGGKAIEVPNPQDSASMLWCSISWRMVSIEMLPESAAIRTPSPFGGLPMAHTRDVVTG